MHDRPGRHHLTGTVHRFSFNPKRTHLAARHEHHMRRNALESIGVGDPGRRLQCRGLQHDELRSQMQRRVG